MHRSALISIIALCAGGSAACGASPDPSNDEGGSGGSSSNSAGSGGMPAAGTTGSAAGGQSGASGGSTSGTAGSAGNTTGGTSGSAGSSAGSAGTAGTVNQPSACDALPVAGTWDNIWPASDGSGEFGAGFSEAIAVDPFDSAIVWLQVGYQGLYKSTDCGATFTHMNTGENADVFEKGNHVGIAVDPVEQGTLYSCSIHSAMGLYKSTNGGVDWNSIVPTDSALGKASGGNIDSISLDPSNHLHIVVTMHSNCNAPYDPTCAGETTDGGATWSVVKTPASGWEEGAGPWVINATTWVYGGTELYVTTNNGTSFNQITPAGAWGFFGGEVEVHPIVQTADGTYLLASTQGIVKSSDGVSWSLIPDSGGRKVGMTRGGSKIYSSDQWSGTYHVADDSDPTTWTSIPAPPAPGDQGAPYIYYDDAHHVLYSSNFSGGTWRLVTE